MHAKSLHLCLILCDPMHCSLPGSYIHEIFQARILEWVAIPFFRNEPILIHSYGLKSILFSNFFSFCLFFSVLFFFFLIQDPIQDTMLHLSIMFLGSPGLYQFPQFNSVQFSSVQFSHSVVSDSLRPHASQHARPPCPSPTPGVYSNSCPLSQWCHPTILWSFIPFSSCPQSLPASRSFPVSSSHEVAKVLEFQLQHQSFQWTPRTDLL